MFDIGDAVRDGISLDRIKQEIKKCIVLCANCHAIRHFNLRNKKQTSPGIAGELEELNTLLAVSPEEEDAYNMQFGKTGMSNREPSSIASTTATIDAGRNKAKP